MPKFLEGDSLARLLQGAVAGAVATIAIGFIWGGWMLGSTAENMAKTRATKTLVEAYAPVCVERFQQQAGVEAKWAEFAKVNSWSRDSYIRDSGFATTAVSKFPSSPVAEECARALTKILETKKAAAK